MSKRISALLLALCLTSIALPLAVPALAAPACADLTYLRTVDRQHVLPPDYVPPDLVDLRAFGVPVVGNSSQLRADAALAYARLAHAAQSSGYTLIAVSAYRSYADQRFTFNHWMQREIDAWAAAQQPLDPATAVARTNRYSALPGQSEHQLGTAVDISTLDLQDALSAALLQTPAGQWLMTHAHESGFVVSYPAGKEGLTGFNAEPWHLRYVGPRVAQDLVHLNYLDPENDVTLGSYLAGMQIGDCTPFLP